MIKICQLPLIQEDTDRWGARQGTYSTHYAVGYVDDSMWEFLERFQSYGMTPETIAEQESTKEQLKNGVRVSDLIMPIMNELIRRQNSTLFQLNAKVNEKDTDDGENAYIRFVSSLSSRTNQDGFQILKWEPSFDQMYEDLKAKCEEMNQAKK